MAMAMRRCGDCGNALIQYLREYDRGFELVRQAVAINPNNLDVVNLAGVATYSAAALMKPSHIFFVPSGSVPTGWARTGTSLASPMPSWCAAIMNKR